MQSKLYPIIEGILEINPQMNVKLEQLRSKTISKLKIELCSEAEIKKQTYATLLNEYMAYVHERLLSEPRLEKLSPGLGKLLSEHARAVLLLQETQEELNAQFVAHIEKFRQDLIKKYSVRSRVTQWLNDRVKDETVRWLC